MTEPFIPSLITSGGQTGVDRGALIAAAKLRVPHGGWVPKGRIAEDGRVPDCYPMTETEHYGYAPRTGLNIECSDATLLLTYEENLTGGSALTLKLCREAQKPCYHLVLEAGKPSIDHDVAGARDIRRWLARVRPKTLNIAGPRASKAPGIQDHVVEVVMRVLQSPSACVCGRSIPKAVWEPTAPAVATGAPVRCSKCRWITLWSQFDVTQEAAACPSGPSAG